MCASLRAQGNTEINKMLMAIRELTVEEFCEKYGADAQYFMSQQTIRRLGKPHMKRPTLIENEHSNTTQKKRSKIGGDMEKEKEKVSKCILENIGIITNKLYDRFPSLKHVLILEIYLSTWKEKIN